jgi:hypothetical protein
MLELPEIVKYMSIIKRFLAFKLFYRIDIIIVELK